MHHRVRTPSTRRAATRAAAVVAVAALALAACGDGASPEDTAPTATGDTGDTGDADDTGTGDTGDTGDTGGDPLTDERCEANRSAGTISFLTGFDYAAAASIVEVITADALGYYDELCLDVEILSSFSTANYPLVAGGQGQFASGGSFSEVVAFARAADTDLVVVTVAGRTPIDTLIVKEGVVTEGETDAIGELAGTTIGVKGKLPASIEVMLLDAGLVEGDDYETVLVEGFDPVAHLAIPSIVGVPGWKSNEPGRLEREGVPFTTFDPTDAGIPGSFGAIFTSREFADAHPTAVEDFVRATLRGLAAAIEDPELAAGAAVELIEEGGNPNFLSIEGEVFRWAVEARLIADSTPPDVAPGTPDRAGLAGELEAYAEIGLFGDDGEVPDVGRYVDDGPARRVTGREGRVVWPGPG